MVEFPCAKVLDRYGGQQLDPVDPVDPGAGVVASVWASAKLGFKQRVAWKCGRDITRGRGGALYHPYIYIYKYPYMG